MRGLLDGFVVKEVGAFSDYCTSINVDDARYLQFLQILVITLK